MPGDHAFEQRELVPFLQLERFYQFLFRPRGLEHHAQKLVVKEQKGERMYDGLQGLADEKGQGRHQNANARARNRGSDHRLEKAVKNELERNGNGDSQRGTEPHGGMSHQDLHDALDAGAHRGVDEIGIVVLFVIVTQGCGSRDQRRGCDQNEDTQKQNLPCAITENLPYSMILAGFSITIYSW